MDNSATSYPKPESVIKAVRNSMKDTLANPGRSSHKEAVKTAFRVYSARERVAEFVNTVPEKIIFTYSATYALNMAIFGVVKAGQRVVTSVFEHNAVLRPIYQLEKEKGVSVTFLKSTTDDEKALVKEFLSLVKGDKKPDALILTHTSNVTGFKLPVSTFGKVCKKHGITFILDASQGLGTSVVDMEKDGVDILCSSGHKGLFGIMGSGFMAVSKSFSKSILPYVFGGTGIFSKDRSMPETLPERLEAGTLGVVGIESIRAGVEYINSQSADALCQHCHKLRVRLTEGLSVIPNITLLNDSTDSTSIVLFCVNGTSLEKASRELDLKSIACRSGFHCAPLIHKALQTEGAIRLSVGAFNTVRECDKVLFEIEKIAKKAQKKPSS